MRFMRILRPILALLLLPAISSATTEIPNEVWANINANGEVAIVITLKGFEPVDSKAKSRLSQMSAARDNLQTDLESTGFVTGYNLSHLPVISGKANNSTLTALYNRDDILAIEFDRPLFASLAESVPLVEADYVQNILGYDGSGVVVAILDTGMDSDHPNFAGRINFSYHFLAGGANIGLGAEDGNGHGTNVAGVVGSSGAVGGVGMAPACEFVAIQVLDASGSGFLSDFTSALNYILANNDFFNINVINASIGSNTLYANECSVAWTSMAVAATSLKAIGVTLVAASGNNGDLTRMASPACIGDIISVGASFDSDLGREPNSGTWQDAFGPSWPPCFDDPSPARGITCFSNRNALLDILAPGRPITSSAPGGGLSTFTGTSQASPHVAGLAALMKQAEPLITPNEILALMKSTGINIFDALTGLTFKHIDARLAVEAALDLDEDGVLRPDDNCPLVFNPGQEDANNDGIGDACCCLDHRGNVNSDLADDVNIGDITYLVNYLFGIPTGPAPGCAHEANANGDAAESVNIGDITYLVNYLFGIPTGPEPGLCP